MYTAYIRRKTWEAQLLSRTIISDLAKALGGGDGNSNSSGGKAPKEIGTADMLKMLGAEDDI